MSINKRIIKYGLLVLIVSSVSILIAGTFAVKSLIDELDIGKLVASQEGSFSRISDLEAESLVNKNELLFYLSAADGESDPDKLILEKNDRELSIVKTDFQLPSLKKNNCIDVYCIQVYTDFNQIPPAIWKGLIGIEDVRFLEHSGFDFFGILRAFVKNVFTLSFKQGASTITQQLMKNTYFSNKKSIVRKVKEVVASAYIEGKFEKEKILEFYLNNIIWGSSNGIKIKGVYTAALYLFGKNLSTVSHYEMAIIISLLKGPYFYHPLNHTVRLRERADLVFKKLQEMNLIPDNSIHPWNDKDWKSFEETLKERESFGYVNSLFKTMADESEAVSDYEKFVFNNSSWSVINRLESLWGRNNVGIKAILRKGDSTREWEYYSKFERKLSDGINNEKHQVGSLLKPIVYKFLINNDIRWDQLVSTAPLTLKLKSGDWSPSEASKRIPAEVTVEQALLWSLNRPLIRLSEGLGFKKIEDYLVNYIEDLLVPLDQYPSQLLGSVELSLSKIFNIYEKFYKSECEIREGNEEYNGPLWVLSNPNKNTLRNKHDKIMSNLSFFAKTGTTNKGLDNWFVFNDGFLRGVIWVGFEGARTIEDKKTFGSTTAYEIYRSFVTQRAKRYGDFDCEFFNRKIEGSP